VILANAFAGRPLEDANLRGLETSGGWLTGGQRDRLQGKRKAVSKKTTQGGGGGTRQRNNPTPQKQNHKNNLWKCARFGGDDGDDPVSTQLLNRTPLGGREPPEKFRRLGFPE